MKTTIFIASAASICFPHARAQLREVNNDDLSRGLFHTLEQQNTVVFDECVGKTLTKCQEIIKEAVEYHPLVFDYAASEMQFDVVRVRESYHDNYFNVGMRTNQAETHVIGILGDGMVFYPWEWCPGDGSGCAPIGPWDCDIGSALTVEACCDLIKDDVNAGPIPNPDIQGNFIACVPDPPIGSTSKPKDSGRIIIHTDEFEIVRHPPRNE